MASILRKTDARRRAYRRRRCRPPSPPLPPLPLSLSKLEGALDYFSREITQSRVQPGVRTMERRGKWARGEGRGGERGGGRGETKREREKEEEKEAPGTGGEEGEQGGGERAAICGS